MPSNTRFLLLVALVLSAAACRFINFGISNFAPIGAIALFGGACFASRRTAFAVTFATMLLSDVLLFASKYREWSDDGVKWMALGYVAFGISVAIGRLLRNRRSALNVMMASLAGSMVFFLLSNFGAFIVETNYTKDFAGLVDCYVQAIPFFRGTLSGDLTFNALLFGSLALLELRVPALKAESQVA